MSRRRSEYHPRCSENIQEGSTFRRSVHSVLTCTSRQAPVKRMIKSRRRLFVWYWFAMSFGPVLDGDLPDRRR